MPIFTENSKLNLLIFQTAYFILNFQNLLEPGLQKTLPELPVPCYELGPEMYPMPESTQS